MDDVMDLFGLPPNPNPQQQQQPPSVGGDSGLPESDDGLGADDGNLVANQQYILENQQRHLIIQAPGMLDGNNRISELESGLASSVSSGGSSMTDFEPTIIEYQIDGPDSDNLIDYRIVNVNSPSTLSNNYNSAFDLAMDRGYTEQAMIYVEFSRFERNDENIRETVTNNGIDVANGEVRQHYNIDNKDLIVIVIDGSSMGSTLALLSTKMN